MSGLLRTILLVCKECFYLLFPLSEDERLVKDVTTHQFLNQLTIRSHHNCIALSRFSDPVVRAVIHLVKFHQHQKAIELAGSLLEAYLRAHHREPVIIIPIPLSATRLRQRGFNQAEVVATAVASKLTNVQLRSDILKRTKHTVPQSSLPKADRMQNVQSAFALTNEHIDLSGVDVILLDDVVTTGATMQAAKAKLLPQKPKRITCVALAH